MPNCQAIKVNGQPCAKNAAQDGAFCPYHIGIERKRTQRHNSEVLWGEIANQIWGPPAVRTAAGLLLLVNDAFARQDITEPIQIRMINLIYREIEIARQEDARLNEAAVVVAGVAAAAGDLAAFVHDRQNVHTSIVSTKTNEGLKMLLETTVQPGQRTLEEILGNWLLSKYDALSVMQIAGDMSTWYIKNTCRDVDDHLYMRTLDGLWAYIKTRPEDLRKELVYRLYEESKDAVGMCCEGHICRLTNVLSGFDESFKPQVSQGELLQQRMADIAGMDITENEKKTLALSVCEDLHVPEGERGAWLEAF